MKILVANAKGHIRDTFFPPDIATKLEQIGEVVWNEMERNFTPEELRERLEGIDVCITGWGNAKLDEYVLEKAQSLKLVAHTGGTVAPLVSEALYDKGVRVISGNEIYARSVAEGVIAYMLVALRDIPKYSEMLRSKGWHDGSWWNEGLLDQTVGLVGFGAIAQYLVPMLKAFDVKIKVYSSHLSEQDALRWGVERATLDEIFSECKIISIHSAATPKTYHMIDRRLLQMIPEGSLFVNTARGSVVDEEALAQELHTGRFKAVLDVYEEEPLPMGSKLRSAPNTLLMPHMAGPTIDRRKFVTEGLLKDIENFYSGNPLKLEITRNQAAHMTK
ncbi:hypothetical protein CDQ84_15410 [Clostridium thermosuccinogenes]|jgi:phosphoglycerate dehydrogenase-like enzyme|uniref:D-isomer specific 2-hydroxyacid dehydrogenase NAD-binding domain-containing protein n=1 Tax=Clostridium thermosuccinogenes TaxID=84032 RepID=A0A2K2F9B8_9CLOT|nr:hydroxyacid dehydrogenase [Pseudoclostridium thermosuccinogenes]AUS96786.1 hypothetical protein CDO33_10240 [Pseudoclostridium thermosuccinogenes]PNT92550.1 hypothetical protein CDQ83_03010 [Pseudoclostridium thermosuccinogenes]PNT95354.1 hypothetical protein CDQ85_15265 [Pseudoclostridium thermosuccinogenes]PNT96368.1 hypothetical protein CDQ84_15410 [Pseudoclostridium thermosuccinogenes]